MSGLEAAGIVLGAIPLVIEALDSYKAGKGRWAIFKKYGPLLKILIVELKSQNIIFSNNIGNILRFAEVELSDSAGFAKSGAGLTNDADANEDIRNCLGTAYDTFLILIEAYRNNIEKLALKLREPVASFNPSGRTCDEILDVERRPDGTHHFRSRLRFTMSKKEIDTMVKDLNRCSVLLERFCNSYKQSEAMESTKSSNRGSKVASSLVSIKEHAQRLFDVISNKWSDCHPSHEVNLRLDSRLDDARAPMSKKRQNDVTFSVGMGAPKASSAQGLPWFETRVIPLEENLGTEKAAKVTIQVQPVEDVDDWPGKDVIVEHVNDICTVVTKANQLSRNMTFFVNANDELRVFSKGRNPAPVLCTEELKPVSLATILDSRNRSKETSKLDRATRLRVAITLASTIFQLSDTAWMISGSIKDHVLFPLNSKATRTEGSPRVDAAHPFISTTHLKSSQNSGIPLKISLLELGIVLLELWHDISFEQFCDEKHVVPGNDFYQRLPLAHEWFDETEGDMLARHSKAVSSCIRCLSKNANFSDRSFRSEMFEGILRPLEDNAKDTT